MTPEQVALEVKSINDSLASVLANTTKANANSEEAKKIASDLKAALDTVTTKAEMDAFKESMQNQFDAITTKVKANEKVEAKTIDTAIMDALKGDDLVIEKEMKKYGRFRLEMPEVKTMTLSGNLTGDSVATYNTRAAIIPSQAVNFRDFVPTVVSPTGLYVTYSEDSGSNNIAAQLEGSTKGENSYSFTEVKKVNDYIAGFSTFSKQMLTSLPFLSGTLMRALQRDFFKAENSKFFTVVSAAATGTTTTTETVDLKQLVQLISNQRTANYNPSVVLVSHAALALLLIDTINAGYYAGSGSVIVNPNGGITIWGVPVVSTSWVTAGKALIIDADYIERVEVSGVAVELSYEDGTNFQKNMVTARIECYEVINLMRPDSAIYATL